MEGGKYANKASTMSKSDRFGTSTMDKIFSKGKWRFFTISKKTDSLVIKRLCMEEGKWTFFN